MYRIALSLTLVLSTLVAAADDAPFYADKLDYIDDTGAMQPVMTSEDWAIRRAHVLQNMQQVMGPLPTYPRGDLDVEVITEQRFPTYTRKQITFAVEPGDRLSAYLCIPHAITGKTAGIVALHQTYALGKDEVVGRNGSNNLRYGQELAERGYVVIAPDYPRFGGYEIDPYAMGYESATMKGTQHPFPRRL